MHLAFGSGTLRAEREVIRMEKILQRSRASHEQKRVLRERVQVDSLEHQVRILAHIHMNPDRVHSVGSLCEELEESHDDGLVLHHNVHLLVAQKKLKHVREISGLVLAP